MSNDRNAQTIEQGLTKARQAIMKELANQLDSFGGDIAYSVFEKKPYMGFTGNSQTSYTSQVWIDGVPFAEYCTGDFQRYPIHEKIELGEELFLEDPYEGDPRTVRGKADIEHSYSSQTIDAIRMQRQKVSKGVAMRMSVGVEYNDFIGDPIGMMYKIIKSIDFTKLRIDVRN